MRELGAIKDDITHLKQTAEEAQDLDNLMAENEILKAKCNDLETKMNTFSRSIREPSTMASLRHP